MVFGGKCKWSESVKTDFPWAKPNPSSHNSALCDICDATVSVASSIKSNLDRHAKGKRHIRLVAEKEKNKTPTAPPAPIAPAVKTMSSLVHT